jgi:glycerol-3-phosphate dehydrogenase
MRLIGVSRPFPLVKAMNLVTSRPAHDVALAAPDRKGRMLTLVPWQGRVIVGTGQSASAVNANDEVRAQDVEEFAVDANHAFPALGITPAEVVLVHRALVPGTILRDGRAELLSVSQIVPHRRDGADNAFSVIGAKYTTARAVAERAIDLVGRATGRRLAPSSTAHASLPFAGIADHEALAIETARRLAVDLPAPSLQHLVRRYAEAAAEIVRIIAERPETAAPLSEAVPTLRAEVVHAIRHEAAVRLTDVLMRRTALGATGHPGPAAVETCAALCASELQWSQERVGVEIAEVEGIYRIG